MKSRHRRWPAAAAMLLYFTTRVQAAITISPTALPPWTVNIAYSQTLTASGCLILARHIGLGPARAFGSEWIRYIGTGV